MSAKIDAGMLELLSSKICHDLISPIGAVNNGLELFNELGPSAGPEATELIAYSAAQASAKLQAFRMAYGAGGANSNLKAEDVLKTIGQLIRADKKISQQWDPYADLGTPQSKPGFYKILTCVLLLGIEALPKGGSLSVTGYGDSTIITAKGTGAGLRPHARDALDMKIKTDDLEPHDVHAAMTALMATHYNFSVTVGKTADDMAEFVIR
jgi:histidine phosphotransferase ChpT